ncbi:ABC transporter permease [Zavarzinia sp. CC-PAN008]|uniref:ABC transporter permease n=1 Tax=Zavarzinia sp. CC-PAN008 TaxID=3243332 RepID=UPI003F747495
MSAVTAPRPRRGLLGLAPTVFLKELRDNLRDRRSLALGLIYPLLGPILLSFLLSVAGNTLNRQTGVRMDAGLIGGENNPALVEMLREQGFDLAPPGDDPAAEVREGRLPVVIVIPPDARTSERFTVRLIVDPTRVANTTTTLAAIGAINAFGATITAREIESRGLDSSVLKPIAIEQQQVGRKANVATFFYNMMPPLIIFMIFLGGVYIAIDSTAGERERGSLEPLLTAPVERWELLLGKSAAAFTFTAMTTLVNVVAFAVLLHWVAAGSPGLAAPPALTAFLALFAISIPLMALAVSLQMSISAITRSMKEAQIYLGLLPVVPAMPGMIMAFAPIAPSAWIAAVPVFGQMMLYNRLISGESVAPLHIAISALCTLALAALLFRWATRLFKREKLFFLG